MTLLQLQYFQVLAHMLHYTRTAEALHISQPSLSYAISSLESELGVKLFTKKDKRIMMTAYGEQFLPYVEQSLATLDEGRGVIEMMSNHIDLNVRLGYFHSISGSLIPKIMDGFYENKENRQIRFSFTEASSSDIFNMIRNKELDMGFSLHKGDWAESVLALNQQLFLAVPPGHALARKKKVTFPDFVDEPMIMLNRGSALRHQLDEQLAQYGKIANPVFEVRECNVAMQYVSLGFGLSVIPEVPAYDESKVKLVPIVESGKPYTREVYLTRAAGHVLTPTAEQVWDYIKNTIKDSLST